MDELQTIHCPGCGKPLEVAPGSQLACPFCGQRLAIESAEPPRVPPISRPRWEYRVQERPRSGSGTWDVIRALVMLAVGGWIFVGGIWSVIDYANPLAQMAGGLALVLLYLAPTISASLSLHPHVVGIGLVNILLGWTIVGWVAAAAWAVIRPAKAAA